MASDTKSTLILMPSYPVLNVIITSYIFILVAHEVNQITKKLSKFAISTDYRYLIRNICMVFGIFLGLNQFF